MKGPVSENQALTLKEQLKAVVNEGSEEVLVNMAFLVSKDAIELRQIVSVPMLVRSLKRHKSPFSYYALANIYRSTSPPTTWSENAGLYWLCRAAKQGHVASIIKSNLVLQGRASSRLQRLWRKLQAVFALFRVLRLYASDKRQSAFWRCEDAGLSPKWQHSENA